MQIDDTLIFVDANFAVAEEKTIINAEIMIKSRNCFDSNFSLKFNDTIIERQENDIYLRQISQSDHLQLIQNVDIAITSSRNKIKLALISKEQYVTQRA
jgi:hypothetical protein